MTWGQPVGLNELMIINPGLPGQARYVRRRQRLRRMRRRLTAGDLYLSEDGEAFRLVVKKRAPCGCAACRSRR